MSPHLESSLTEVENLLEDVSGQMLAGDAPALESTSTALRLAMIDLSNAAAKEPPRLLQAKNVRERFARVSRALVMQRENLARRAAVIDRSLNSILPRAAAATYASPAAGLYKSPAARIYANNAG